MLLKILQVITFLFTIVFGFSIAFLIVHEFSVHHIVGRILEDNEGKNKIKKKAKKVLQSGENIHVAPVDFLHKLIIRSNLHYKFFTPATFILISVILLIASLLFFSNLLAFIEAFVISLFISTIPEIVLYLYGEKKSMNMNASYIGFLNLLENFLSIRDDINYAMEQTSNYQKQLPLLSDYCRDYVFDITHGYTPMDALKKFAKKVENVQIKNLLYTLISCNINSGKYLNVVKQSKSNYLELYDKLIERQTKAHKGRFTIIAMLVIYALIFIVVNFIVGNLYYILTQTSLGIAISVFSILSFIITFFVAIDVGHFKFS